MIHFKCLYTNILVEDAINSIKELVKKFDDVLPNAGLIIKLLSLIHKKSLMAFNREYFKQNFRVIMGTNNVPILANMYLAKLEELLREKCKTDKNWCGLFCLLDLLMMVLE